MVITVNSRNEASGFAGWQTSNQNILLGGNTLYVGVSSVSKDICKNGMEKLFCVILFNSLFFWWETGCHVFVKAARRDTHQQKVGQRPCR
jgi:hypothetical protein